MLNQYATCQSGLDFFVQNEEKASKQTQFLWLGAQNKVTLITLIKSVNLEITLEINFTGC